MLRYLADLGIAPGSDFTVLDRQPFGGPLRVRFGKTEHMLGGQLAASMRVETA
jgi:DtxR family Mn-dependent transcriptional regulator